ncbi:MAG: hypothetical protein QOH16_2167 [Gaiellaceae bacterium]|nr:hypothetical protein [Gaiellaceae bacterium]
MTEPVPAKPMPEPDSAKPVSEPGSTPIPEPGSVFEPGSRVSSRSAHPYTDLHVIDSRAPRTNQAVIGVLSVLAVATGWWWLLALLALQLAVGLTFGRRYCLPCVAYFEWIQPRFGEGPLEDSRPPRAANLVGLVVLSAASIAYASGWHTAGVALGLLVAALALLAAVTGFCTGCEAYKLGCLLRGRPFVSCPIPPRPSTPRV